MIVSSVTSYHSVFGCIIQSKFIRILEAIPNRNFIIFYYSFKTGQPIHPSEEHSEHNQASGASSFETSSLTNFP
jgi:hypothetical protein